MMATNNSVGASGVLGMKAQVRNEAMTSSLCATLTGQTTSKISPFVWKYLLNHPHHHLLQRGLLSLHLDFLWGPETVNIKAVMIPNDIPPLEMKIQTASRATGKPETCYWWLPTSVISLFAPLFVSGWKTNSEVELSTLTSHQESACEEGDSDPVESHVRQGRCLMFPLVLPEEMCGVIRVKKRTKLPKPVCLGLLWRDHKNKGSDLKIIIRYSPTPLLFGQKR